MYIYVPAGERLRGARQRLVDSDRRAIWIHSHTSVGLDGSGTARKPSWSRIGVATVVDFFAIARGVRTFQKHRDGTGRSTCR